MKKKFIIFLIFALIILLSILISVKTVNNKENGEEYSKSSSTNDISSITTETAQNTTIQGIVELHRNGYIYIFNGEHFGEYGFEMEEYTSANINDVNQKCIDYVTLKEYDTSYIEEGDILICTGDLILTEDNNNFDTKDNNIIVLKSDDFDKMKLEAISGKRDCELTVGEYFKNSNEIYLKYSITDGIYNFPFVLKFEITDDMKIPDNIEKGNKIKVEYEKNNVLLSELKLIKIEKL